MILAIAWRNVWRNWKRSAILLAAIAFGIWAGLFTMGITEGMYAQMIDTAVTTRLGHVQVHEEGYLERSDTFLMIDHPDSVLRRVRNHPHVRAAAARALIHGMASSAATTGGVTIHGVHPDAERAVTRVPESLVEGEWFGTETRNPIVLGSELADRLELRLGNRMVLQAEAADSTLAAGAFRLVGIFRTPSSQFDETSVFARYEDIDRIFELEGGAHEIMIVADRLERAPEVADSLAAVLPGLDVKDWKEISPALAITADMGDEMLYLLMVIILLALVFGITNTMLMAILERVRELGVLMAVGMKQGRVFAMVILETLLLSIVGGALGMLLGWATIAITGHVGINLASVSEGLSSFGVSSVLYPTLPTAAYPKVAGLIILTALISAVYPGIKAVRLQPVDAIRTL